ncbi:beta-ketoacyl synthase chain length factor [Dyadobacter psychrotolerans]|uniref:3-oxoacyl-ACP synthase n=1 Tax=Dyadobacter psychrotolerans TaxID=2541721 RepID=A0A4R5DE98_9BACT|nr:beta-ketoacyl synthase chain length factor [Dyadobacter psychrotolerans]TDE10280.1 3-oxoacyl-ACP synthase [Dyadobacter psychrotolerans]
MFYISAASSITHQPTFKNAGFSASLHELTEDSELISPNYKDYIDAALLRRMSKILRMSVACAKTCLEEAEISQPDSIVVGTGLGCLQDTEKFLGTFLTIEGLLPPTSFIQSTHNTIAGQISLSIGNHGYNMTHTQNTLSFEHALIDSMLLLSEDNDHVLVGAADEYIEILDKIQQDLHLPLSGKLSSGASFFMLSKERSANSLAGISAVETIGLVEDIQTEIQRFLTEQNIRSSDLDMVLFPGFELGTSGIILDYFINNEVEIDRIVDYLQFSGIYPTTSAFAMHYAIDRLGQDENLKNILVCNCLNSKNLGLTLIQSLEA